VSVLKAYKGSLGSSNFLFKDIGEYRIRNEGKTVWRAEVSEQKHRTNFYGTHGIKFQKLKFFVTSIMRITIHRGIHYTRINYSSDRLCVLVVSVPGCRLRGPVFGSRRYQIFWVTVCSERGPLSFYEDK
jgi:hypothetical protein